MVARIVLPIAAAVLLAACGPLTRTQSVPGREPRLVWEGSGLPRVEDATAVAQALPQAGPGLRRGVWGEGSDATYHLLETEIPEPPHLHAHHDLTVIVLRGRGTLFVEDRQVDVRAGDVLYIIRGRVHHFHPAPGTTVTGLAIYTPRLEKSDFILSSPR